MKRVATLFPIAGIILAGCNPAYSPDMTIVCVEDESGIEELGEIFAEVSATHELEFSDGGQEVEELLAVSESDLVGSYPIRTFHAHNLDESIEISASNLGMTEHQFAVSRDTREFARAVTGDLFERLDRSFVVIPAEEGKGALPVDQCAQ